VRLFVYEAQSNNTISSANDVEACAHFLEPHHLVRFLIVNHHACDLLALGHDNIAIMEPIVLWLDSFHVVTRKALVS